MPLYIPSGSASLLAVGGSLAGAEDCCCCVPCQTEMADAYDVTLTWVSGSCCGDIPTLVRINKGGVPAPDHFRWFGNEVAAAVTECCFLSADEENGYKVKDVDIEMEVDNDCLLYALPLVWIRVRVFLNRLSSFAAGTDCEFPDLVTEDDGEFRYEFGVDTSCDVVTNTPYLISSSKIGFLAAPSPAICSLSISLAAI